MKYLEGDPFFKLGNVIVRVSDEAWTDIDVLNKNKAKAEAIAHAKIKHDDINSGQIWILTDDVRAFKD